MMLYCVHLQGKFRKIHLLDFACVSVCLFLTLLVRTSELLLDFMKFVMV